MLSLFNPNLILALGNFCQSHYDVQNVKKHWIIYQINLSFAMIKLVIAFQLILKYLKYLVNLRESYVTLVLFELMQWHP